MVGASEFLTVPCRLYIVIVILGGGCLSAARSEQPPGLSGAVPANVGLYVEVRGIEDLLARFTDPQIWSTLAELAGQPAQPEDVAEWRARVRQTIKMEPEEAIRTLFSGGVAFVGEGLGLSQDAVIICRPDASVDELLKRWEATRLDSPADPPAYRLYNNIGVTVDDGLLYFGDLIPAEGLLSHMRSFVSGARQGALANDPEFQKLRARVPDQPDGLFFLRWSRAALTMPALPPRTQPVPPASSQPTSPETVTTTYEAPSPGSVPPESPLPMLLFENPLRNANNILLALHRRDALLRFTAVADRLVANEPNAEIAPVRLIHTLPVRSLLVWQSRLEFGKAADAFLQSLARQPISGVFQIPEQVEALRRMVAALDSDVCVAIGPVFPKERLPGTPPLPAAAVLVGLRDPETIAREFRNVINVGVAGYSVYAYAHGLPLLQPIEEVEIGGSLVNVLDLSPLLKPSARHAIGEIHLAWTIHERVLILTSHSDWLRQIIEARVGRGETLAQVLELAGPANAENSVQAVLIQSGPIGDIVGGWLDYLRRNKPEVFEENWWRDRQPAGWNVRLGVDVVVEPAARRLAVTNVHPELPAHGRLRAGDYIVGYGDRYGDKRFQSEDLIAEMTRAVHERPHARWLVLLIDRNGITRRMRLPIPFIAPIQALNRMAAIGRIAQRAVYCDDRTDGEGPRGYLTIELRSDDKPLFDFSEKTAASAISSPSAAAPETESAAPPSPAE